MTRLCIIILVVFSLASITLSQNVVKLKSIESSGLHKTKSGKSVQKTLDGTTWAFLQKGETRNLSAVINNFSSPIMLPLFYAVSVVQEPVFMSHQITDVYKETHTIPGLPITEYWVSVDYSLTASQSAVPGDYIIKFAFVYSFFMDLSSSTTDSLTIHLTIMDVNPPEAPQLVFPDSGLTNQLQEITFQWNNVPDPAEYAIQVSIDQLFGTLVNNDTTAIDTTKTLSGLSIGQKYYWRVRAKNLNGIGPWSSVWNFTVMSAPAAPVAKPATSIMGTGFMAHWDSVTGASGYLLDVSQSSMYNSFVAGYNGKNVSKVVEYAVSGLALNTPHYYRVRAYNTVDTSGNSSSISVVLVGVDGKISNTPDKYELAQNYPNPFNPSTLIQYSVPQTSFVAISVYDLLGKEIVKLVNEEKPAGNYTLEFHANKLTSGVYFYTMQTGSFIETRKFILMK